MTPALFKKTYMPFAKQAEAEAQVPADATLVQAALESLWGDKAPLFNFFGIKDTDGVNGNEQLLQTVEYSAKADLKFPVIISVTPCVIGGKNLYKYVVKDYFRKYNNAAESFRDHALFLKKQPRYAAAFLCKDASSFLAAIARAGYATDPSYNAKLQSILKTIQAA